jgi:hypothetical protein
MLRHRLQRPLIAAETAVDRQIVRRHAFDGEALLESRPHASTKHLRETAVSRGMRPFHTSL